MWGQTKGNALDSGRNESERDDLEPGISNRDSLKQSDKYPSSCRDSLDNGIPNVKCQETDPIDQTVIQSASRGTTFGSVDRPLYNNQNSEQQPGLLRREHIDKATAWMIEQEACSSVRLGSLRRNLRISPAGNASAEDVVGISHDPHRKAEASGGVRGSDNETHASKPDSQNRLPRMNE